MMMTTVVITLLQHYDDDDHDDDEDDMKTDNHNVSTVASVNPLTKQTHPTII